MRLLLAVLVVALLAGCGGGDEAPSRASDGRAAESVASEPLERLVGELLMFSFDGTTVPRYATRRLRAGQAAGVILFGANMPDAATVRATTTALHRAAGGDALIATDQEGGVIRSVAFAPPAPGQSAAGDPESAAAFAREGARALRRLGINVNLAPVADLGGEGGALSGRAYPGGPGEVAAKVAAAVAAHTGERVAATAKHFPGLGRAAANTDDEPVTIVAGRDQLEAGLAPYRDLTAPLVMTSHALYPAYDRSRIASQSPALIDGLLRGRLGYEGVVMTDSIEADAVLARSGVAAAALRSIEAGTDIVLMTGSGSWNLVYPSLLARARRDARFRARVERSAARVRALRERFAIGP